MEAHFVAAPTAVLLDGVPHRLRHVVRAALSAVVGAMHVDMPRHYGGGGEARVHVNATSRADEELFGSVTAYTSFGPRWPWAWVRGCGL